MEKEIKEKDLIRITKRLDKLENYFNNRKFILKIVNSISDIQLCENCKKIVMARIGGISWFRKGFFQTGNIKGRIANWCSKKCEKEDKNH